MPQRQRETEPSRPTLPSREPAAPAENDSGLSWLSTAGNLLLRENGEPILLRGVNVPGLDLVAPAARLTMRDMLALDDDNLAVLAGLWGANVVRLPFSAGTVLRGSRGLGAAELLTELDDLISALADAGIYTLMALDAPPAGERAAPPDDDAFACLSLLAARYRDSPGVLFEPYASRLPKPAGWQDVANRLIGAVRIEHPAALVFVGGQNAGHDVSGLPIRFATGAPVHNLVYTLRFDAGQSTHAIDPGFHQFARSYPLFASEWFDGGADLGRGAELAGYLFSRYGIGWAAANWNAEPRLVVNAAKHQFAPTRFGLAASRSLALPVRVPLFSGGAPAGLGSRDA